MDSKDWDAYWRNAQSSAAHLDGGAQDRALELFWTDFFAALFEKKALSCGILDVACGNGAVPRFALTCREKSTQPALPIIGVDDSHAALSAMRKRDPQLGAVLAGASQLPFAGASFDIVSSQFGMEYAGGKAFLEAARVLKPEGTLAAVTHLSGGAIFRECEINLQAIEAFRGSQILESFAELFQTVVIKTATASREEVRRADRRFAAAVAEVEQLLQRRGRGVASETLFRIYADLGHMYRQLQSYDAEELLNWVRVMNAELESYAGRMASMLGASLSAAAMDELGRQLQDCGLQIRERKTLEFGQRGVPAAWVLLAVKQVKT